jgi:hypothetical protein
MDLDELVLVDHGLSMSLESSHLEHSTLELANQTPSTLQHIVQTTPPAARRMFHPETEVLKGCCPHGQSTTFRPNREFENPNHPSNDLRKAPTFRGLEGKEKRQLLVHGQPEIEQRSEPIVFPSMPRLPQRMKDDSVGIRENITQQYPHVRPHILPSEREIDIP